MFSVFERCFQQGQNKIHTTEEKKMYLMFNRANLCHSADTGCLKIEITFIPT